MPTLKSAESVSPSAGSVAPGREPASTARAGQAPARRPAAPRRRCATAARVAAAVGAAGTGSHGKGRRCERAGARGRLLASYDATETFPLCNPMTRRPHPSRSPTSTPAARPTWSTSRAKAETHRVAAPTGVIRMQPATLALIAIGGAKKGDVLGVARIAAIQARQADRRADPAVPSAADHARRRRVRRRRRRARACAARSQVETVGRTGVEMEALTAVQVGLLTDLRHVQGGRSRHGDRRRARAREARRQVGRLGRAGLTARRRLGRKALAEVLEAERPRRGLALERQRPRVRCRGGASQSAKNSRPGRCGIPSGAPRRSAPCRSRRLVERLGPGHHQARVEQVVRRALERRHHLAGMLGGRSRRRSRRGGRRACCAPVGDALRRAAPAPPAARR